MPRPGVSFVALVFLLPPESTERKGKGSDDGYQINQRVGELET